MPRCRACCWAYILHFHAGLGSAGHSGLSPLRGMLTRAYRGAFDTPTVRASLRRCTLRTNNTELCRVVWFQQLTGPCGGSVNRSSKGNEGLQGLMSDYRRQGVFGGGLSRAVRTVFNEAAGHRCHQTRVLLPTKTLV
eukprot:09199_5